MRTWSQSCPLRARSRVTVALTARADGVLTGRSAPLAEGRYLVAVTATTSDGARTTLGAVAVTGEADEVPADEVAPTTTATVDGAPVTGWYRASVEVALSAGDEGSGVEQVRYRVGDGDEQVVEGDRATVPVTVEGTTRISFWAVDRAGNIEDASSVEVRLDRTAPTLACTPTPGTLWAPHHKLAPITVSCATAGRGHEQRARRRPGRQ